MSCDNILREKGYRLTPQRMLVIEALHNADNHISAEEIFEQLHARYPYSNISTVYRTLELMKRLNLVTEADFGEGRVRYHAAEKGHHHHLVCHTCGKITDLDESVLYALKHTLLRDYDFEADLRHLAIPGECSDCHEKKAAILDSDHKNKPRAMSDIHQRLPVLLGYWIEHNREHEQEFRQWADKVAFLPREVAQQLQEAAGRMAAASNDLEKARQVLTNNKEGH